MNVVWLPGEGEQRIHRDRATTSGSFSYLAYGMGIRATMPLPELVAGAAEGEVSIRYGRVDRPPSPTRESSWVHRSPTPEDIYLSWQGVGAFLVQGGNDIVVDPYPGVDDRMLRLFVLGPVLAVLLRQRGHLLLHASAVAVHDKAILFLGGSGWGKSTMAAALYDLGHGLLSDDVAVLRVGEGRLRVFPGLPQLKLWPEALVSLGDEPEKLSRWNPQLEKRARPATQRFSSTPLPVERIYVLDEGNAPKILSLRPQEAFVELVRHTYGSDHGLHAAMGVGSASHFLECASVVNEVTVCRLRRQKSLSQLHNLARLVEEDLTRVS